MFEIEAIGLDTNGIKGIKTAHDDFVKALDENGDEAITKLAEAIIGDQLQVKEVEYLIKLTGYNTRMKIISSADNKLMHKLPVDCEDAIKKIAFFAMRE